MIGKRFGRKNVRLNQRVNRYVDLVRFGSRHHGIVKRKCSRRHALKRSVGRMRLLCVALLRSSTAAITPSCRFSWAFLIIGLATAPVNLSATIVDALCLSPAVGALRRESRRRCRGRGASRSPRRSLPSERPTVFSIILAANLPSSMLPTRFLLVYARPTSLSTASGGTARHAESDRRRFRQNVP